VLVFPGFPMMAFSSVIEPLRAVAFSAGDIHDDDFRAHGWLTGETVAGGSARWQRRRQTMFAVRPVCRRTNRSPNGIAKP